MFTNKGTLSQGLRLLLIAALMVLFTSGILYSARSIRYPVDGKPTTEFQITKLSLTHEVERDARGKLADPYAQSSLPGAPDTNVAQAGEPKLVVIALATDQSALQGLADQQSAPKPGPKKPGPKKPAPKHPKKKSKPKACPT